MLSGGTEAGEVSLKNCEGTEGRRKRSSPPPPVSKIRAHRTSLRNSTVIENALEGKLGAECHPRFRESHKALENPLSLILNPSES